MRKSLKTIEILLVEDNPGDARLIAEIRKESDLNHHLTVVSDGMSAIALVRKLETNADALDPDLILLDLDLPRKNGLEVLEEIKADAHLREIPILVLTGMLGTAAGGPIRLANGLVSKPTDTSEFAQVTDAIHQLGF